MIIKYLTSPVQGCSLLAVLLYLLFIFYSPAVVSSEKNHAHDSAQNQSEMEALLKSMENFESEHQPKVYACPMHPDEVNDKPGSCSICGMFLVAQQAGDISQNQSEKESLSKSMESFASKHQHKIYACPMHADEVSDKPGSCSLCGMYLVAQETGSKGTDSVIHKHSADSHSDKQVEAKPGIRHEQVPMGQKAKPALFWQSSESQAMNNTDTNTGVDKQPVTKRLLPEERPGKVGRADQNVAESPQQHARKHQDPTYICPMHPQIMQNEPGGNCPICGMNLVAKAAAIPAGDTPQVFLQAAVIQNMGVRTAKVVRKVLRKQIRTQGLVTPDVDRVLSIHPRAGGWIERLYLLTEGDHVERKDELVDFHSPWINQVQLDFITALEEYDQTSFEPSRKTELVAKVDSLRNSLRMLNVMDMDIMRIENRRKVQNTIQMYAPQGGVITRLNVSEGSYVEPYDSMFTIVDLSTVWVMVDIYEHQAPWVRKGNVVEITAPAIPARSWNGVVDYIYPQVDPKTRTLRARITLANPDEALLLNMFVEVGITANTTKQRVLTVPREAVIVTGERETVIKSLGKGHFQPVEVKTGRRGDGSVEILSGLKQDDEIVVSGQFLIDSESSLQASFLRMSE